MYVGSADVTCTPDQAIKTKEEIGEMVKDFKIYPGVTHEGWSSKGDKEFVDRLAALLGNSNEQTDFLM